MRAQRVVLMIFLVAVFAAPHLRADVVLLKDTSGVVSYVVPPYYVGGGDVYPYTIGTNTIPATLFLYLLPCAKASLPWWTSRSLPASTGPQRLRRVPRLGAAISRAAALFKTWGGHLADGLIPANGATTTLEYQYAPEPSGYLALSVGLGLVGAVRFRRKREKGPAHPAGTNAANQ